MTARFPIPQPHPTSYDADRELVHEYEEVIRTYVHDVRGRIMGLKLRVHVLEKQAAPDIHVMIDDLKAQLADLTDLSERLRASIPPVH